MSGAAEAISGIIQGASSLGSGIAQGVRNRRIRKAMDVLGVPPVEQWKYEAMLMGNPELLESVLQGRTELEDIAEDPRLRLNQMQALEQVGDIVRGGGYTDIEKAQMAQMQNDILGQMRGGREALDIQMGRRGMLDSGFQQASQLANTQAATNLASQRGLDIAAQGQMRGLEAVGKQFGMGSGMRGQEWGQQAQTAGAQDSISRFNTQQMQRANELNQQAQMQTDLANQAAINKQRADAAAAEKAAYEASMARASTGSGGTNSGT
jgi:hypothetical protein